MKAHVRILFVVATKWILVFSDKTGKHNLMEREEDFVIKKGYAPTDCTDIKEKIADAKSGIYRIYPVGGYGTRVYCDMTTDGGGWTVIQRRFDGSVNFYRKWKDYEKGFGDLKGEFWLGNRILHVITVHGDYELRVDLADFDGNTSFALYKGVKIGNFNSGFRLLLSHYNGTAGDALSSANRMQFSTHNRDQDEQSSDNCARIYHGAWWFKNCFQGHLNGIYTKFPTSLEEMHGIIWIPWRGNKYSLKATSMKLRKYSNFEQ